MSTLVQVMTCCPQVPYFESNSMLLSQGHSELMYMDLLLVSLSMQSQFGFHSSFLLSEGLQGIIHSLQYFYWLRCNTVWFYISVLCSVIRRRVMEILDIFYGTISLTQMAIRRHSGDSVQRRMNLLMTYRVTSHVPSIFILLQSPGAKQQHYPKGYIRITRHSIHVELEHEFGTIWTG